MILSTTLHVYTANAQWFKLDTLVRVDLVLRAAGGPGSSSSGGGGGAAVTKTITASDLPDTLSIIVGVGNADDVTGADTRFGELLVAPGGTKGALGGGGGLSNMRGGQGGTDGVNGQSVTSEVVTLLAGGGGGAGLDAIGGYSGFTPPSTSNPPLWQWNQSGGGGNSGQFGGFPAGGGGAGAPGGNGVCTVIEVHREAY